MSPAKVRVLCVDDDVATNHLHALILEEEADMEVVGTVSRVEEVLPALEARAADAVLLDLRMGGDGAVSLLDVLTRRTPPVRVVVLSGLEEPRLIEDLLARGASGYVTKGVDVSEIAPAIRKALRGERPVVRSNERR
jgi:DNA-binding NarL/FixJ family response regulator